MRESLGGYGDISGKDCHNLQIDLFRWQTVFMPKEIDPNDPTAYRWVAIEVRAIHLYLDLADLNEEKINNNAVFSGAYIKEHKKGSSWVGDVPLVMFQSDGLKKFMEADVDLSKINSIQMGHQIKESDMGIALDYRRAAFVLLQDQRDADYFKKALYNAIVTCKATK
jgi:hypothetical protein